VADIISLDNKLASAKEKKTALTRRRKIRAVQKVFQCTQCALKCEKCGTQISSELRQQHNRRGSKKVPYRFCKSCMEEYLDYIERHKGSGDMECYWRNEAWLKLWKSWIDYQGAIDSYLNSKEFKQLLQELKQHGSDE
jgi:Pyruvate/2-oxoacid:ferredoxin oxidoreductase delta subunit